MNLYELYKKTFLLSLLTLVTIACAAESNPPVKLEREDRSIDRDKPRPSSYADVVEQANDSVVSVYVANIIEMPDRNVNPEEQFLRRFFGLPVPEQRSPKNQEREKRRKLQGFGSGTIVTQDGYILTNNHVVTGRRGGRRGGEKADEIFVQLKNGKEYEAKVIGRDPLTDVAVIKIDEEGLPALPVTDSSNTKVGDQVFAIGNPMRVGLTVTQGIISAKGRQIGVTGRNGYENFIQTDASINPGNSGGPLIDVQGRLVGVNSAILSGTGGSIGLGFAIPSNIAVNVMKSLVEHGEVKRGFLGVSISDLTPEMAKAFGVDSANGAVVNNVEKGLPADKAGIKRGDLIVAVEGKPVNNANDLRLHISQQRPGSTVEITLTRDGDTVQVEAKLADIEEQGRDSIGDIKLLEGVSLVPVDEKQRKEYDIPERFDGMLVEEVKADSPYSRILREGMVMIEVNDKPVRSADDLRNALRKGPNKIFIYDRGYARYLAISIR